MVQFVYSGHASVLLYKLLTVSLCLPCNVRGLYIPPLFFTEHEPELNVKNWSRRCTLAMRHMVYGVHGVQTPFLMPDSLQASVIMQLLGQQFKLVKQNDTF